MLSSPRKANKSIWPQMSNYNPFSLDGKTILVTGASSGIGQATAIECSKLGAKLVITGRNVERLQQTFELLEGEGHAQIIAELTRDEDVKHLAEDCPELNGLVLCAGKGLTLPVPFCTKDKCLEMFTVNFFAPFELLRLLYKMKKIAKSGSVVAVSSIGGNDVFSVGNSTYGATKAALSSVLKFCAKEFAGRLIRVNAVHPGMTDTPLIHRGNITEEQYAADAQRYLLKRYGKPEDIAHGITYLLSEASSWVTGHSLVIDGGVSV